MNFPVDCGFVVPDGTVFKTMKEARNYLAKLKGYSSYEDWINAEKARELSPKTQKALARYQSLKRLAILKEKVKNALKGFF